jgi:hypothetical protein
MKGKSRLLWSVMDLIALCYEGLKASTRLLVLVDKAQAVDNSDDCHWKEADEALTEAIEMIPHDQRMLPLPMYLRTAQAALRRGMGIDFGDTSLVSLKAEILPQVKALEEVLAHAKKLAAELDAAKVEGEAA